MKNLLLVLVALICFSELANAQQAKLVGTWLVTKVETGGEIEEPFMVTEFTAEGKMVMMGMEVASWKYNKKANSIEMESDFDKDFSGVSKILKLNADEFIYIKDDTKVFCQKLDETKIVANNKKSGLLGMWDFEDIPNTDTKSFITFKEPDAFTIIQKGEYSESTIHGSWIFNKKEKSLILIGFRGEGLPKGKCKIVAQNADGFELENKGKVYKAKRKEKSSQKIERLTFSEEDFYTEDGDFKYEADEEKLPWRRWDILKKDLLNVTQLVYNYYSLIENTEAFETKILTANVHASMEEEGFNIDNIFDGYDSNERELEINDNFSDPLYPLEGYTFRIVGEEQITTPAGTFDCTVLEIPAGLDGLKKVWMVNDKIGVFAKIIEENTDDMYGFYHIYELQEIKEYAR